MSTPKLRQACDRCHAQKLSCRRSGTSSCPRCIKAGVPCTSSPSMRNQHHRKRQDSVEDERDAKRRRVSALPSEANFTDPISLFLRPFADWSRQTLTNDYGWSSPGTLLTPNNSEFYSGGDQDSDDGRDVNKTGKSVEATAKISPVGSLAAATSAGESYALHTPVFPEITPSADPFWPEISTEVGRSVIKVREDDIQTEVSTPVTATVTIAASNLEVPAPSPKGEKEPVYDQFDPQWLSKVADLNIKLYTHASKVSSSGCSSRIARDESGEAFDKAFALSLELIDTLRETQQSGSGALADEPADPSRTAKSPSAYSDASARPLSVDSGTALLVLSCYVRILEMYAALLSQLKASATSPCRTRGNIHVPALTVGSCSLQSYPSLQTMMILDLVEKLVDRIGSLLTAITTFPGGRRRLTGDFLMDRRDGGGVFQHVLAVREERVFKLIGEVRERIDMERRGSVSDV